MRTRLQTCSRNHYAPQKRSGLCEGPLPVEEENLAPAAPARKGYSLVIPRGGAVRRVGGEEGDCGGPRKCGGGVGRLFR